MTPAKKEVDLDTYAGRFGARLRELREKAKLSQADLAAKLVVGQNTISRWELGERFPPVNSLPKIAEALNLRKTRDLFPNE